MYTQHTRKRARARADTHTHTHTHTRTHNAGWYVSFKKERFPQDVETRDIIPDVLTKPADEEIKLESQPQSHRATEHSSPKTRSLCAEPLMKALMSHLGHEESVVCRCCVEADGNWSL